MRDIRETLNNALVDLSWRHPTQASNRLLDDWSAFWDTRPLRESLGPFGIAMSYGALVGYWSRYKVLYERMPEGEAKAALPRPDTIRPTASKVLTTYQQKAVKEYIDVGAAAYQMTRRAIVVTVDAVQAMLRDVKETTSAGASSLFWGLAILGGLYIIAKRS